MKIELKDVVIAGIITLILFALVKNQQSKNQEPILEESIFADQFHEASTDEQLLGMWEIENIIISKTYTFHIFDIEHDHDLGFKIFDSGIVNKEVLIKTGNRYYLKDSRFGEYYLINNDTGELRMFDHTGDLGDAGYHIKLIKYFTDEG